MFRGGEFPFKKNHGLVVGNKVSKWSMLFNVFWQKKICTRVAKEVGGGMMKSKWDSLATTIVQSLARMVFSLLTGAHFFCLAPGFLRAKIMSPAC
jgi:hypothetical protein